MPCTLVMSSVDLNGPFVSRYSTIRCARTGPIPRSVSNCSAVALFMFSTVTVSCPFSEETSFSPAVFSAPRLWKPDSPNTTGSSPSLWPRVKPNTRARNTAVIIMTIFSLFSNFMTKLFTFRIISVAFPGKNPYNGLVNLSAQVDKQLLTDNISYIHGE